MVIFLTFFNFCFCFLFNFLVALTPAVLEISPWDGFCDGWGIGYSSSSRIVLFEDNFYPILNWSFIEMSLSENSTYPLPCSQVMVSMWSEKWWPNFNPKKLLAVAFSTGHHTGRHSWPIITTLSALMPTLTGRLWFPLLGQLDCQQGALQGRLTLDPMERPGWTNFEAQMHCNGLTHSWHEH